MVFLFLLFANTTEAQSYDGKGDSKINVGYNIYGYGNGIKATYGYGLSELFSLGAGVNYKGYKFDYALNDYGEYLDSVHRFTIGVSIN